MKLRLALHTAVSLLTLALAAWVATPAHAVTLTASLQAAPALDASPAAGVGHVTGEGVDESSY